VTTAILSARARERCGGGARHAIAELHEALAARHGPRRDLGEQVRVHGVLAPDLVPGLPLVDAERALAQPLVEADRERGRRADLARRLLGAPEVAAVERVDALACEPRGGRARLRQAARRERAVAVTLDAPLAIPGRLAVADDEQLHGRELSIGGTGQQGLTPPAR
jgi:hypothetical protein